jgi:nucleoside-diphosphate-sugar epimerase
MKVLFIGGTGNISTSASKLAVERGFDLYLLNRGKTGIDIPGAKTITANINEPEQVSKALGDQHFDAVVNWIAFTPKDIERDIELFSGRTNQYIFISSASVYQKAADCVITESTPLANPHWEYSRNKIACEQLLENQYREKGFPFTTVRPSLTYGEQLIPLIINSWGAKSYTLVDRIKKGKKVIVPGDGTSVWTITHSDDFAKGIVGLLGNQRAIAQSFHITSDELLTWNEIYAEIGRAVGAEVKMVHIASDTLIRYLPHEEGSLHGDKNGSSIFDNSKLKRFVPDFAASITWAQGLRRSMAWFEAEPGRIQIDEAANATWDKIIEDYEKYLSSIKA